MTIQRSSLHGAIVPVGGPAGLPGQSAYQAWLALGNVGTLADFVNALRGAPGVAQDISSKLDRTGDGSGVRVATARVPGGQALSAWFTNPALSGIVPPNFGGTPRIVFGSNPDGQTGFSDTKTKNPITLLVDTGGYGNPTFSGFSIPESITGAISVPANATGYHASGVAGYARTASPATGAVGLYGQGDVDPSGTATTPAWGFNTRTQDNGVKTSGLWGGEIDVNVSAAGTFVRGLDIVGGSTAQPDAASPGIIVQSPGVFQFGTANPIRWGRALLLNDESAYTGIEIGTALAQPNSGSMPVTFQYRDGLNVRAEAFRLYSSINNGVIEVSAKSALLKLRGDNNGTKTDNITIYGGSTGIGDGGGLPAYALDVTGPARFSAGVGFNGATPVGKAQLPAALSTGGSAANADIAASINALRACLIGLGVAQ